MTKMRLEGKLALITGASHGIGAAVAEEFARQGADLILTGRDSSALEEVDDIVQSLGRHATLVPLDLKNFHAIDEMVHAIAQRFKKLDILVGNAGVLGHVGPITDGKPDTWQDVMDVNLTANWRLLKACDPLLKQSPAGRAMFVTSGAAHSVMAYFGPYSVSKVGLEHMVKTYALEVSSTYPNLKVNLVDPLIVRTNMRAKAFPGEDPIIHPTPDQIVKTFVDLAADDCSHHGSVIKAEPGA